MNSFARGPKRRVTAFADTKPLLTESEMTPILMSLRPNGRPGDAAKDDVL